MNVSVRLLDSTSTGTDSDIYNSASYTPRTNRFLIACFFGDTNGIIPATPSVTGNGLTWTKSTHVTNTFAGVSHGLYAYYAYSGSSPTTGALTMNFLSNTMIDAGWVIQEFTGLDGRGSNGIVQGQTNSTVAGSITSMTVTMSAFQKPLNISFGAIRTRDNASFTAGSGFTEIADTGGHSIQTQWKATQDTSIDWTWPSGSNHVSAIGLELKRASTGAGTFLHLL